jgi:CheY-like chemotaxis protein
MSRRILVVEDQEDNRMILRDLLHSAGSTSATGRAARRKRVLARLGLQ